MKIEKFHPFETKVMRGLISSSSQSVVVNAGKVYNYYNPLNFRNVLFDRSGVQLPNLPFPMSEVQASNENLKIEKISLALDSGVSRVAVYLVACFKPPTKWVPGRFYIPIIDSSWVVFLLYANAGAFEIRGETKNPEYTNIRNETFDVRNFEITDSNFFESSVQWKGNVSNLGLISLLDKDLDGKWTTTQLLKENFPVTALFNSNYYEMANTNRFDTSIAENSTQDQIDSVDNKIRVANLFNDPGMHFYRGNVKWNPIADSPILQSQHKLPLKSFEEVLDSSLPFTENPV